MKIAFIGKFKKLHDEEYIARSFEMLGHEVLRIDQRHAAGEIKEKLEAFIPELVMWTKLMCPEPKKVREICREYKTVCWVFDLYFNYEREFRLSTHPAFTADYVFTTDGGNDKGFKQKGINHHCVRQGIYQPECVMLIPSPQPLDDVIFVGSENGNNPERARQLTFIKENYGERFKWFGRYNTDEIRGLDLNLIYSQAKIVIGDSVYSPHYWSNRIVETLGRGGFLIHQDVPGLKEEYPFLVTYPRGDFAALKALIDYYLEHEEKRQRIVQLNYDWVKERYTMEKKCAELLEYIK